MNRIAIEMDICASIKANHTPWFFALSLNRTHIEIVRLLRIFVATCAGYNVRCENITVPCAYVIKHTQKLCLLPFFLQSLSRSYIWNSSSIFRLEFCFLPFYTIWRTFETAFANKLLFFFSREEKTKNVVNKTTHRNILTACHESCHQDQWFCFGKREHLS